MWMNPNAFISKKHIDTKFTPYRSRGGEKKSLSSSFLKNDLRVGKMQFNSPLEKCWTEKSAIDGRRATPNDVATKPVAVRTCKVGAASAATAAALRAFTFTTTKNCSAF